MSETLSGQIERVTFHNPESGFAVLKVQVAGQREPVTVIGTVLLVATGEWLEATGTWRIDRDHGRQFQATTLKTTPPTTAAGIERYLGSGAIRSLGPKLAERIVKLYKERSLQILDDYPEMLLDIRGVGREKLQRIRRSWQEQRGVREIMLFLSQHGIGPGRAVRIYREYGDKAIETVRANPYQLADDVRGFGFKTADELAARLGLDPHSPFRARAAVRYVLQQLSNEGHCGYPQEAVLEKTQQMLGIERTAVEQAALFLITAGELVHEEYEGAPWLFLTALHRAETGIAESVRRLAGSGGHPLPQIDIEAALHWVEQKLGVELAEAQRDAIRTACREKFLVITGGPGVGKTTLVRSLIEIFEAKKCRCVLAAPTGRAAKRLAETTGRPAQTIHRLLEFNPKTGDFVRQRKHPLHGDLFVLDETSMVDVVLANQFLRAVPVGACVVLVGDVDQLPSVGPGQVLHDLIATEIVPIVRLTRIFRQGAGSRITAAAHAINAGQLPEEDQAETTLSDFYFAEAGEPAAIQRLIVRLVTERIPERFKLDPQRDIQILCPMNRGALGSRQLNELMQATLNPPRGQAEILRQGWTFRIGDRVLQTVNNYDRDVFNGDLGTVAAIDPTEQELRVTFEDRTVLYDFGDLDELAPAYVLTIHKSQGSEYPCVIIPLHTQHYVMLQRNLLYTAVTRGKTLVILVGTRAALELAVQRKPGQQRLSALAARLRGDL